MLILYDMDATILDIRNPDSELVFSPDGKKQSIKLTKDLSNRLYEPIKTVHNTQRSSQFIYCNAMTDGKEKIYDVFLSSIDKEYTLVDIRYIHEQSVT